MKKKIPSETLFLQKYLVEWIRDNRLLPPSMDMAELRRHDEFIKKGLCPTAMKHAPHFILDSRGVVRFLPKITHLDWSSDPGRQPVECLIETDGNNKFVRFVSAKMKEGNIVATETDDPPVGKSSEAKEPKPQEWNKEVLEAQFKQFKNASAVQRNYYPDRSAETVGRRAESFGIKWNKWDR